MVFFNLKLVHNNVRVRHNDGRQLAEDNPGLEEEVEFLRLHQLLLLHPAPVTLPLSVRRLTKLQHLQQPELSFLRSISSSSSKSLFERINGPLGVVSTLSPQQFVLFW